MALQPSWFGFDKSLQLLEPPASAHGPNMPQWPIPLPSRAPFRQSSLQRAAERLRRSEKAEAVIGASGFSGAAELLMLRHPLTLMFVFCSPLGSSRFDETSCCNRPTVPNSPWQSTFPDYHRLSTFMEHLPGVSYRSVLQLLQCSNSSR